MDGSDESPYASRSETHEAHHGSMIGMPDQRNNPPPSRTTHRSPSPSASRTSAGTRVTARRRGPWPFHLWDFPCRRPISPEPHSGLPCTDGLHTCQARLPHVCLRGIKLLYAPRGNDRTGIHGGYYLGRHDSGAAFQAGPPRKAGAAPGTESGPAGPPAVAPHHTSAEAGAPSNTLPPRPEPSPVELLV